MVSSEKMLLNTGMPSGEHPVPVSGLHSGDEYFRSPTSVIGFGLGRRRATGRR